MGESTSSGRWRIDKSAIAILACAVIISILGPNAESQGVSMRVSPASIVASVRDGDTIGPLLVTNRGKCPLEVRAACELGGHDQAGVPVHREVNDPSSVDVYLTLDPAEFRLPPGGSIPVRARVRSRKGFSGGAYPVVVFRARQAGSTEHGAIVAASQIAVLTYLTVSPPPGEAAPRRSEEAVLKSLTVEGGTSERSARILAECENTGTVHTSISGAFLVRDGQGIVATQGALASVTCLPGCTRVLSGLVDAERLRKGTYIAEVRLTAAGRAADSALIAFRVEQGIGIASTRIELRGEPTVSQGTERSQAPRIAHLGVPVVSEGRGLPVEVVLESPPGTAVDPLGYVEIWDYQMKRVGVVALQAAGQTTDPGPQARNGRTVIRVAWPGTLPPGYYTARATLQWDGEGLSVSAPFVVGSGISMENKG